jgi:hypothetical protein
MKLTKGRSKYSPTLWAVWIFHRIRVGVVHAMHTGPGLKVNAGDPVASFDNKGPKAGVNADGIVGKSTVIKY